MDFTPEQQHRFIDHLMNCHSWYKHLPLIKGGQFYIVVDENADQNYPAQHPSLRPFENNKKGYNEAFGRLNYFHCQWKNNNFYSDCYNKPFSKEEIEQTFPNHVFVQLYPYVSGGFREESIYQHKEDYLKIIEGEQHEQRDLLITFYNLSFWLVETWQNFTDEDSEIATHDPYFKLKGLCEDLKTLLKRIPAEQKKSQIEEYTILMNNEKIKKNTASPLIKEFWLQDQELVKTGIKLQNSEKNKLIKALIELKNIS